MYVKMLKTTLQGSVVVFISDATSLTLNSPAVDRSVSASLSDARDAMTNAAIDSLTSYRQSVLTIQQPGLLAPACLRLFPLFILALLKQVSCFITFLCLFINFVFFFFPPWIVILVSHLLTF